MEHEKLVSSYLRKNFSLAWPMAFNALLLQSMLVIDTLLVSPLGEVPLAGLGIAVTIIAFFLGLQIAVGNGTQLLIGRIAGAGDVSGLQSTLRDGFVISTIAACVFLVVILLFSDRVILLVTQDNLIVEQTRAYLSVLQFVLLPNAFSQTLTVFLNGQGDTKTTFKVYVFEVPFNTVLSYFLMFGSSDITFFGLEFEGLGIAGAAWGSVIAVCFRLALLYIHVKDLEVIKGFRALKDLSYQGLVSQSKLISPIAANFVVLSLGYTIFQLLFSQLDIFSYVAVTLVFPWLRMATHVIVAWAQANSITVTQAIGQGNQSHIVAIVKGCVQLGLFLSLVVSAALFGWSVSVESLYPNIEQNTLLALATIAPLYILLPLVRTYNTIAGNLLRAIGKSVQVLRIHFVAQWLVILPLCALFILYFELSLFWAFALLPAEEVIKAWPFYRMLKKSVKEVSCS